MTLLSGLKSGAMLLADRGFDADWISTSPANAIIILSAVAFLIGLLFAALGLPM